MIADRCCILTSVGLVCSGWWLRGDNGVSSGARMSGDSEYWAMVGIVESRMAGTGKKGGWGLGRLGRDEGGGWRWGGWAGGGGGGNQKKNHRMMGGTIEV